MNINSSNIGNAGSLANTALRDQLVRNRAQTTAVAPSSTPRGPITKTASSPLAPDTSLSAEAPAGTDPELWKVLSSTERSFFAKVGAMGPLTYGRVINDASRPATPAMRGGRLDIRG